MSRYVNLRALVLFVSMYFGAAAVTHAAVITLSGGDSTDGWVLPASPVLAYDLTGPTETIQGVTFQSWTNAGANAPSPPAGVTLSANGGSFNYGYGQIAYASPTANDNAMQAMIFNGFYNPAAGGVGPLEITITGLTAAHYRFDAFTLSGDSTRVGENFAFNTLTTDTFTATQNVSYLVQDIVAPIGGQIVLDVTSLTGGTPILSGFALSGVPEPSSLVLLGLGAVLFLAKLSWGKRRLLNTSRTAYVGAMVLIVVLVGSQFATAGTFSVGTFSTPGNLGLDHAAGVFDAHWVGTNPASSITVGAVTFTADATDFQGNFHDKWSSSPSTAGTFADSNLNNLVDYWQAGVPIPLTGTITGFTAGNSYILQLFTYDGDAFNTSRAYRGDTTITAGADTLTGFNQEAVLGGYFHDKGVYIDYTFVATGTTLAVSLTPAGGSIVLSAFDVRQLPEPGSFVLFGLGAAGLLFVAHRRRRHA